MHSSAVVVLPWDIGGKRDGNNAGCFAYWSEIQLAYSRMRDSADTERRMKGSRW
jgi:hypothetical protein